MSYDNENWSNESLIELLREKHREYINFILDIRNLQESENRVSKNKISNKVSVSSNTADNWIKELEDNGVVKIKEAKSGKSHDVSLTSKGNQIAEILYPLKLSPTEIEEKAEKFRRKTLRWPDTDELEEITGRELNIQTLRHIEDFRSPTKQIKERKRVKLHNRLEKAISIKDKEAEVEKLKDSSSEEWRKAAQYYSDNEELMEKIEKKSRGKYKVPKDMENYVNKDELEIQPLPAI